VQAVVCKVAQSRVQLPQVPTAVLSASQPLEARASQSKRPALHDPNTQVPAGHVKVAVAVGHGVAQAEFVLQFVTVRVLVSQPGVVAPSQSANPAAQD